MILCLYIPAIRNWRYVTWPPGLRRSNLNKPFSHPVIIPLLHSLFFIGSHSHYLRYQDIFISSLSNWPGKREVPMVMLALVCTSVHLIAYVCNIAVTREIWPTQVYNTICKFETAREEKDIEFSYDTAHNVYQELLLLLQQIKSQNPLAYHMLTTQIFTECMHIILIS